MSFVGNAELDTAEARFGEASALFDDQATSYVAVADSPDWHFGAAEFTVVLDSVDTNNEIRDPRMRQFLFETDKHPYAKVTAQLDMAKLKGLETGARHTELLDMTIELHGLTDEREFYVMVTRLAPERVLVENKAPLILDAADFGFEAGVEKLRELAGLDSITPVVPVTFSLVFEHNP